jgi:hypothetical protein
MQQCDKFRHLIKFQRVFCLSSVILGHSNVFYYLHNNEGYCRGFAHTNTHTHTQTHTHTHKHTHTRTRTHENTKQFVIHWLKREVACISVRCNTNQRQDVEVWKGIHILFKSIPFDFAHVISVGIYFVMRESEGRGLYSSNSRQVPVVGCCEYSNEWRWQLSLVWLRAAS